MDPSMLAAAASQARNRILKNQKDEVITESGGVTKTQASPQKPFVVPKSTPKPEKPADWRKPDKKYGGTLPKMTPLPGGDKIPEAPPVRPDLSTICEAVVNKVQERKSKISDPQYCMKVRETCHLPCCQYLHQQQEEEEQHKKVIIKKKIIRRRRPKQAQQEEANANGGPPPLVQEVPPLVSSPPPLVSSTPEQQKQQQRQQQASGAAGAKQRQQQEEAARRQAGSQRQQQQQQQQEEAERKRQEEEYKRQQAEHERQRQLQQQQEEEEKRQRQAQAVAQAPAPPTQKAATFTNLGTDPAMAQAELYYESTRWGPLGHGDPPVSVGTFPGHRWFIVANGVYAKLFTIGEEEQQSFTL